MVKYYLINNYTNQNLKQKMNSVFVTIKKTSYIWNNRRKKMQTIKENIKPLFVGMLKQTSALLSKIVFAQYSH